MDDMFDDKNPLAFKRIPENPVVLDFTGCTTLLEVHRVLKLGLGFPDYYGDNWDALWDLLRYFRWYPITIEVRGLAGLPPEFAEEIAMMRQVFEWVHQDTPYITFRYIS